MYYAFNLFVIELVQHNHCCIHLCKVLLSQTEPVRNRHHHLSIKLSWYSYSVLCTLLGICWKLVSWPPDMLFLVKMSMSLCGDHHKYWLWLATWEPLRLELPLYNILLQMTDYDFIYNLLIFLQTWITTCHLAATIRSITNDICLEYSGISLKQTSLNHCLIIYGLGDAGIG